MTAYIPTETDCSILLRSIRVLYWHTEAHTLVLYWRVPIVYCTCSPWNERAPNFISRRSPTPVSRPPITSQRRPRITSQRSCPAEHRQLCLGFGGSRFVLQYQLIWPAPWRRSVSAPCRRRRE